MPLGPRPEPTDPGRLTAGTAEGGRLSDSSQTRPDWWQTGVVYQIYPRSFADANGDGVGDLAGIADHLDHLGGAEDSLPIDAIWLSPIYPSPDFDFGYDVADYVGVDPRYGTLEDFKRLVDAAHRRGIRIVLDLVLNHTSHRHAWFEASRASREGPYADWYIWRDSPGRTLFGRRRPPNNWRSFFGGSAWQWDEGRGQFYLHTFLPQQPDLNWRNPAVREALMGVVKTWLDRGVDGFRLDVFNTFFKDATLRDNPPRIGRRGAWSWQRHLFDRDQPELADALAELRGLVDAEPGRMTVGELFDGSMVEAARFIARGHLIFDWTFIQLPWRAAAFRAAIAARDLAFGPDRWPANVLSNHDQSRHVSRYLRSIAGEAGRDPDGKLGDAIAKVSAAMLLTLRGTPFLYYGEEIGLRDLVIPSSQALDPPARRASFLFPWWNRDQARGPMHWTGAPDGGFGSARPWLPLGPDVASRNVAAQAADPDSLLSWYRRLLRLRRATPALERGGQRILDTGAANVLAYVREGVDGSPAALAALNFGATQASIATPQAAPGASWRVALATQARTEGQPLEPSITLGPYEALVALEG